MTRTRERGFSFIEALIALTILLTALATLLQVAAGGQRLARSQSEASDLHQRARVAAETLHRDLARAGAGAGRGPLSIGLTAYFAPIVPARTGARRPDPSLSAFADRISIVYVAEGAWPSTLGVTVTGADPIFIDAGSTGCPAAGLCGFQEGTRALLFDAAGVGAGHDLFTVTGITGALAHDAPNPPFASSYEAGRAFVVPVVQHIYYLDRASRRLMVYDAYQGDMPLIDNVVDVRFEYYADSVPSSVARPAEGTGSCVYGAGPPPVALLDDLGGGLRPLSLSQLTDGPVCGVGTGAFDGDLLRIRLVRATLRLQAAADDVRGSGVLFARPGRSSSGDSYVPDYEITFDVAPRNMTPTVLPR